jgi:acetyl-CoA carboxylase biotin carboxylase subunit
MEVNTRIQVEHPVTEEVTGADLIIAQISVAAGERIAVLRKHLQPLGHAIEFRVNAEDPRTFVPSPGKVTRLAWPTGPGVRIDSHLYAGYTVPPHYDSLLAKIIVRGADRAEAVRRARRALACTVIEGVQTSIPLFLRILDNAAFVQGDLSTRFLERQAIV